MRQGRATTPPEPSADGLSRALALPRRRWLGAATAVSIAVSITVSIASLSGCANTQRAEAYDNREWMQSGANRVANLALRDNLNSIRRVQMSLYRRNPREWRKWAASPDEAMRRTWDAIEQDVSLPGLNSARGIDAVRLGLQVQPTSFEGDRIAALVVGWATMLKQANGDTWSQTMLDGVDAENSYRAARNMEISLWLISSRMGADGQPLLLSTEISERGRNLLVDRELSKVVARLDLLAAQADEKYRRAALDFSQNWLMGNLGPFFALVRK